MNSIKTITKTDLEGKWLCKKELINKFEDTCLIFRNGKITFNSMFDLDYQLKYNEQTNTMFLEFKDKDTIEIWQISSYIDKESMIIKYNGVNYYLEKL